MKLNSEKCKRFKKADIPYSVSRMRLLRSPLGSLAMTTALYFVSCIWYFVLYLVFFWHLDFEFDLAFDI